MRIVLSFAVLCLAVVACAADLDVAAIQKRVAELQPKPAEKRFDEIGWATDLRDARRLAQEHQRPVFLFTHDGRMNIGRC